MTDVRSIRLVRWLRVARTAVLVEAGLRLRPLDELANGLGISLGSSAPERKQQTELLPVSTQVSWAFYAADRVLRLVPGKSRCLRRALIAGHLLREHKPSLHIGSVKRDGQLSFHAWLELDGRIAADAEAPGFRRLVRAGSTG